MTILYNNIKYAGSLLDVCILTQIEKAKDEFLMSRPCYIKYLNAITLKHNSTIKQAK
jgi:hypothetical protein